MIYQLQPDVSDALVMPACQGSLRALQSKWRCVMSSRFRGRGRPRFKRKTALCNPFCLSEVVVRVESSEGSCVRGVAVSVEVFEEIKTQVVREMMVVAGRGMMFRGD